MTTAGAQPIRECADIDTLRAVFPIMRQLRTRLDETEFIELVRGAAAEGYGLWAAWDGDRPVGAIGWRLLTDLAHGRSLYVDDLVVDVALRSRGIGEALMCHADTVARQAGCSQIRLSSRLEREEAHRFYERLGMRVSSYTFVKDLVA